MNEIIIEYLKVLLTWPVLFSSVAIVFILKFKEDIKALILRIAKIRFPGGELSTQQSETIAAEEAKASPAPTVDNEVKVVGLPADLTPGQRATIEQLIRSHIATAYVWEYRYLNYFLARATQMTLDWIIGLPQATTYTHFESVWIPLVPSANERQAIINALQMHHLVEFKDGGLIEVTPKGKEYQQWRGVLPPLTKS